MVNMAIFVIVGDKLVIGASDGLFNISNIYIIQL